MILAEQKINRIGRQYWRGSKNNSWTESQINFNCFYVTTKPVYAASYAKDENDNYHYLTQYALKEKINIFNMRYKKDEEKLKDFLRVNNLLSLMDILKYLKDEDWLTILSLKERGIFIELLRKLKYDGFFNIECVGGTIKRNLLSFEPIKDKMDLYGFSGIGIFNKNCLVPIKEYYGWDQIKKIDEIESERESQFDYIKRFLINVKDVNFEELESRFFLLTKKEIKDIVDNFDCEKEKENIKEDYFKSRLYKLEKIRSLERSKNYTD